MAENIVVHKLNPNATGSNSSPKPYAELAAFGQQYNRNINAASSTWAAATNTVTWPSPGVSHVELLGIVTTTAGGLGNNQGYLVVYDAPNDATASSWLADAGTLSTDVQYDLVFPGQLWVCDFRRPTGEPWFITRLDVLPIGATNTVMRILVRAC